MAIGTVLVVEDDPLMQDVLTECLKDEGYTVAVAVDEDTLWQTASARPQVILMDIHLPGMDGLEVLRQLRVDECTRTIPVVLMSASSRLEELAQIAGATAVLAKPFDLDDLLALVHRLATPPPPPALVLGS